MQKIYADGIEARVQRTYQKTNITYKYELACETQNKIYA